MKTLIAYASKTGTVERCAAVLQEKIAGSALVDLRREKPDPSGYDRVIIGGSVRMGVLHVDARQYLDGVKPLLLHKPLGIFLCAGFDDKTEQLFENNVDSELRAHALACVNFGGEIDLARLRGFEKLVVKLVMKSGRGDAEMLPHLFPERIAAFAALFDAGEEA